MSLDIDNWLSLYPHVRPLEKLFDQYKDKYLENSKSATLVVH